MSIFMKTSKLKKILQKNTEPILAQTSHFVQVELMTLNLKYHIPYEFT